MRKRLLISALAGLVMLGAAALPFPWADLLALPGFFLAGIFWPEGVHTGSGLGPVSATLFISTLYLGTAGFWGAITYSILGMRSRK